MRIRLLAPLIGAYLAAAPLAAFAESSVIRLDYQLHSQTQLTPDTLAVRDALFGGSDNSVRYDDLWARIRSGFQIPELDHPLVEKWENYYADRPDYLNRIVDRGNRYLYFVVDEVEKRGMPMEIALLPMIESAYNPRAESPARAAGMWQFIPETGKHYGLERTWWYDGRRDVVAATGAALDYLETLHGMFGDWQLALASYNWGENAVKRAVDRNAAAGLATGFADLRMPDETRNYVPKLLAIRNIIANPAAYGVALRSIPNQPYFATVRPGKHMDVKVAAELAQIPVDELLRLNPGFIRPVIAHKDDRVLVLPQDKVGVFQENLRIYDKPLLSWQPYVTQNGENIDTLASRFGISADELRDINEINEKSTLARGQTILVPKVDHLDVSDRQTLAALSANRQAEPVDTGINDTPRKVQLAQRGERPESSAGTYRVTKGDTAYSVARRYGMTVEELQKLNGMKTAQLKPGQSLKVAGSTQARPPQRKGDNDTQKYVAKRGDTYSSIAKRYNVATADLLRWNNVSRKSTLQPGTLLVINN
ncbi:LysM peptidoglycan-binding domain-containing protein [Chitinilyticum piscinae]|uniref:LysM peptidoglycan-binding domain-containing protein n=1 Tax=Chitinilyticum piscinae TaxID=2866724 RepID=A0A8J7K1N6_9NEIS|nr:LysM peptidoglycan-binding domain-containing protein [Chitinilyticum piscinae]MBE9608917.1 LysM peptidoglycan-binding domain-containing protein [Chitinilyticum piscinae]